MADNQQKLQSLSNEYQQLQEGTWYLAFRDMISHSVPKAPHWYLSADLQTTIAARQKLESQQEENRAVQKEFKTLADDSSIYKLMGPVLLKQDKDDAKRTVDGRLDFIEKEIKRVEGTIKDSQERSEKMRGELGTLQQKVQMEQQGGEGKGA
jgi:prefoldin beta subunit